MKKRVLSLMLAFVCLFCIFDGTAFAANVESDYLPGIREYYQELDKPSTSTNTMCNAERVTINAGGNVKYDFILPFDAAKLDIKYSASANTTLTVKTPRNTYTAELLSDGIAYQLELEPEHKGVTSLEISSTGKVVISELKYTKIIADLTDSARKYTEILDENGNLTYYNKIVEYTEYQELLKTAVIVSEKATVIKSRNLTRYINFEDTTEATTIIDGKMYLPVSTFSKAFGLYCEDYVDLMYAYISGEDFAIYLKPGDSYYESKGEKKNFTDIAVYKNGKTYVPVRMLAELLGYTVYYKDGLAIIDNKIAAREILNNEDVLEMLKEELSAYEIIPERKKAKVYHVSKDASANDENPGTEEAPFATIQRAADVAQAGETVVIHEGVYRESVKITNSGTASKPIVFKAAEGEDVTVSAFKTVNSFTPYTNPANNVSMYVADLSNLAFECALPNAWDVDRNFVVYNDDVLVEGRHPNQKTSTAKTVTRYNETTRKSEQFSYVVTPDPNPAYTSTHDHKLLPTQGDMRVRDVLAKGLLKTYNHTLYSEIDLNQDTVDYWKGATYIGRVGMAWNLSAGLVTASKKNEATVSEKCISSVPMGSITYYQAKEAEDYGYLTHHLNTVDKAGEWYIDVDDKKMYVIPPNGADPSSMEFEVKERQVCFDMRDTEYVQLHNINTRGGGITMAGCTGCILDGGTHKYISQLDLSSAHCLNSFDTIYARYDTIIDDYKFGTEGRYLANTSLLGETGFVVSGHYNAIVNTDIEYSAAAGISVDGSYNYIENNLIEKTGYGVTYRSGVAISSSAIDEGFPAGGHQVYSNTVSGAGRAAFSGGGRGLAPWDVAYNDLGWANTGATDSGVFYIYGMVGGTDLTPTTVHHNAMHDNVTSDIGSTMTTCLYSDGHTTLGDFYCNMLYHSSDDETYIMPDDSAGYRTYEFWQGGNIGAFQRHWENVTKTFESPDKVKFEVSDYPNGYPFYAGALRSTDERFMMNYDRDRDNCVRTLANEGLNWGSYKTDDGLVVLPEARSTVRVDGVSFGEKGTRIDLYYQGDKYSKNYKKLPTVTLELIDKNNQVIGRLSKPLKKYATDADELSHMSLYASEIYKDCTSVRLSTTARDVYFAKVAFADFNLEEENKKVDMPYDSDVILIGSADVLDNTVNQYGTKASISSSIKEFNIDKEMYLGISVTSYVGAKYEDRVISGARNKLKFKVGSNYANSRGRATVYIGNDATGEVIADVNFADHWKSGEYWSNKTIEVDLKRQLEPGTYDFYVKWNGGGTTSFYMAFY